MNLDQVYLGTSYCLSSTLVWRGLSGGEMGGKARRSNGRRFLDTPGAEKKNNLKLGLFT